MSKQYTLKDIYQLGRLKGLIQKDITYKEFSEVSRDFNKEISSRIVNNAYKFNFGLGLIELKRSLRRGKSINWDASKKLRQAIIDRGEIPFNKETAPEGAKWLIYFEGKDYYKWKWFKNHIVNLRKNVKYYIFRPMRKNRREIAKVVKENPFADIDYGIYK